MRPLVPVGGDLRASGDGRRELAGIGSAVVIAAESARGGTRDTMLKMVKM